MTYNRYQVSNISLGLGPQALSSKKSFTVIEMMIVLAIIGLISTMLLANYRTGQTSADIIGETQKITGIFKQTQSWSLSGYEIGGSRPSGYGIYIEYNSNGVTSYTQFADDGDNIYDVDDTNIQTFSTIPSIVIISPSGCTSLVFKPPAGTVYCNGSSLSGSQSFTIWHNLENRYLYIKVNSAGQIDIVSSL